MAKSKTKWERLLDMSNSQFNRMGEKELRDTVKQLNRIANQRLRRLKQKNIQTPATAGVARSGGTFTTRNKDLNQLRAEYRRVANFLISKTSTIKGYKEVQQRTAQSLKEMGVDVDPENLDDTMIIYERLKENNPWIQSRGYKYAVLQEIDSMDDEMDIEDKIFAVEEQLDRIYEGQLNNDREFDVGVSRYFEQ